MIEKKIQRAIMTLGGKAASAALLIMSLPAFGAGLSPAEGTIPGNPDEAACLQDIKGAFRFSQADTPLLIENFINEFPASIYRDEATMMLADWYFFKNEYPLALQYYSKIRDNSFSGDTQNDYLYRKGYSLMKTGFYKEAANYFNRISSSSDYNDAARFYLAYIDYVNGNYDRAYARFSEIKDSGPKGREAEYYINQIDYRNGDFNKVAQATDKLLSCQIPDEMLAETIRVGGLSYFKLGNRERAKNLLSEYADLAGDGAEISALYALGTIYYDEGNYMKALPLFSIVTEYPGDLSQSSWLYIGQIYMLQGDTQAAALAFDKASRESWNPGVAETASYNLAVSSATGMSLPFSEASKAMENFIDSYPSSPYASSLAKYLANSYYSKRDYEAALRQSEKIANPDASSKAMRQKILYQAGINRLQQGDLSQAINYLSEASSLSYDKEVAAQAALWLGDALYAKKDFRGAAREYEKALNSGLLGDNKSLAWYNLGYSLMKSGNYNRAENAFKNAIDSKGLNPSQLTDARLRYGDCLYYNGKYQEALNCFRYIKTSSDNSEASVFASIREADILGRNGQVNEKIAILEGLSDPQEAGIWLSTIQSRLADAYSEKGEDRKAATLYAAIIDSDNSGSDNSQSYYSLAANADNLYRIGDYDAALNAYRKMETSGIASLYPSAVLGIMRTSSDNSEIAEYASKAISLSGVSAEERNEAIFTGAQASLHLGAEKRREALSTLRILSQSPDRLWGARAAVILGKELLNDGDKDGAENILLYLVDNGSDDNYWLALGYIQLADTYAAQGKDYLAKLYLESLRDNYPGGEKEITDMINSRLKKLSK